MTASIVGILLAAGCSRRYGQNKLLQPLPDGTCIGVRSFQCLASGCDSVVVVVRPDDPELMRELRAEGANIVLFEHAAQGMGASLAFGVRSSGAAAGWVVGLADMPFVRAQTITALASALRLGAPLCAPYFGGRRGHPVGFSREFFDALANLSGDIGARSILAEAGERIVKLPSDDPGILVDIDLPSDLG